MLVRWGASGSFLGDWLWPDAWTERSAMEETGKALGIPETLFFNNCHWIYSLDGLPTSRIYWEMKQRLLPGVKERRKYANPYTTFFNSRDNSYVNGYPSYLAIA